MAEPDMLVHLYFGLENTATLNYGLCYFAKFNPYIRNQSQTHAHSIHVSSRRTFLGTQAGSIRSTFAEIEQQK
eukprot:2616550-Pleurochrysis_carterae.AAC.1